MIDGRFGAIVGLFVLLGAAELPATPSRLTGGLELLEPWVGTWQIEGEWASGTTLWAQAEYSPLLGGRFLEGRVFVRDGGGELYQRYRTVFAWDEDSASVNAHTFSADGSHTVSSMQVEGVVVRSEWSTGDTGISERMELTDPATLSWQVWATPPGGQRAQIMDGSWHKVEVAPVELSPPDELADQISALGILLGGWELSDHWTDGTALWARSEYRVGLGGLFVDVRTFGVDDEGNDYQRSSTVFAALGEANGGTVVSFGADGGIAVSRWATGESGGVRSLEIRSTENAGAEIEQLLSFTDDATFSWRVVRRDASELPWQQLIEGTWCRQGQRVPGFAEAVDPDRFVSSGAALRSFTKEQVVAAPVAEVYAAWTTPQGWGRLWAPPAVFNVELAIGGPYEWMFNGWLGSNGCQVLSYIPDRMVSFSWNAPPSLPDTRLARTWVVVETTPVDGTSTNVRLTHLGFGDGAEWDATMAYFEQAWGYVLGKMAERLADAD